MQALPRRVQADLDAATALETRIAEGRANGPQSVQVLTAPTQPAAEPAPPSATQAPAAAPAAPPAAPAEDFEAKFKTLQGMYKADVTKVRQAQAETLEHVATLTRQVQQLTVARETPPAAAPGPDPKDVEAFGADIIEMVTRYVEQKTAAVEGRVAALERQVTGVAQTAAKTSQNAFYTTLDSLVPQWRAINEDPRWLVWLGEVDDVYQVPRQAALDAAFEKQDAQRVAKVFISFVRSLPAPAPAPVAPPAESLESLVAPSGTASVTPSAVAPQPILSAKSINDFYNDVGRGRYEGREQEQEAIEAQINLAVKEGRVVEH